MMIKHGLNRKSENFVNRVLEHWSLKAEMRQNLRKLRFQGCEIGKAGVKLLKVVLGMYGCRVESLDVSYNMLQSDGVNELASVLLPKSENAAQKEKRDKQLYQL